MAGLHWNGAAAAVLEGVAAGSVAENKDNWKKAALMRYRMILLYQTSIEKNDLMCGEEEDKCLNIKYNLSGKGDWVELKSRKQLVLNIF
jgi:hypothetical protein